MGFCARAFKNGEVPENSPKLKSSTYASMLEDATGWSFYFQTEEQDEPDFDSNQVRIILGFVESQRENLYHWETHGESLLEFLRYCVDNDCGIQISF